MNRCVVINQSEKNDIINNCINNLSMDYVYARKEGMFSDSEKIMFNV